MADKRFYITTPIYYVNGKPHIGHAYTSIAADAAARWQRARGRDVFFMTGTDEHGQKVLEKAVERGMTPVEHVDDMVVHWRAMMDDLGIAHDKFLRTTDADHIACVQATLQALFDKGEMYQATYTGWYSPAAERFWTEKDLVDGKCPDTGLPVQKVEETNWFFKMGAYQQRLIDHIQAHPGYIRPESRKNEVLGFLRKPLADLCISRPKTRMDWGIEIPFDRDYVTYVWFDALLNYVSGIGYAPGGSAPGFDATWPADFHLVGKDILTTHAVYWSTMLMAMELPLPGCIYAHGWWMSADGAKMSKSLGNTIDVDLLAGAFGVDAVRFFVLREIAFGADGQFSYEGFLNRYNADLANDLGNLAHRGLTMTRNWLGGTIPELGESTGFEAPLRALAADVVTRTAAAMDDLQFHAALAAIFELVGAGNKYVDDVAPWTLNKQGDTPKLATAVRTILEVSALAGALLSAFLPAKSAALLAKVGRSVDDGVADLQAALADGPTLARLVAGTVVDVGDPLFPRFREMPEAIAALFAAPEPAAAPPPAKASKPAPAPEKKPVTDTELPAEITIDDFAKVALRAGRVVAADRHPDADRLLVLQVDVGEEAPRQIVAGIASAFAPEDLVGRQVVVVVNLKPVKLRGVESRGMLLAAGGKQVVDLCGVNADPGTLIR
ncbi:MAG: methionine--tRNA ligase [Alphaproteobacteria bacterium]|nr:methionine--tRNA ligase [Alphaproteobacteria bacterium]